MKAIMVMFDTLARDFLPNFGNDWIQAQNFERLSEECVTFGSFYAGSMPCMPARRELHTGNYNFLHRSWGPLEPFDHSVFEDLDKNGIYTHLITDHSHYFEDGGATYHNRYSSWESFRGQEGDRWQPRINAPENKNHHPLNKKGISVTQHMANRTKIRNQEENFPSVKVISQGLEFLKENYDKDNWFLQIECFDPHEPFYVPEKYRELYTDKAMNNVPYWPLYGRMEELGATETELKDLRNEYAALISMCDHHLGRVLDFMDTHQMWDDTLLIVNTDHGFLLGEKGWIGKNASPHYDELVHVPYFMHIPQSEGNGTRIDELAQTIDIPATLRDYFGIPQVESDGKSLLNLTKTEVEINHENVLFGIHGGHVNLFDGHYTYMRASQTEDNGPLTNVTLIPTNMRGFFSKEELASMEVVDGDKFTNHTKVLKFNLKNFRDTYSGGDLLFDLKQDPKQLVPLSDEELKQRLAEDLRQRLIKLEAPKELMIRMGYQ